MAMVRILDLKAAAPGGLADAYGSLGVERRAYVMTVFFGSGLEILVAVTGNSP